MDDEWVALEERSLNAWPSLKQQVYDGWLLRFAQGYTRRANSVVPLYAGRLDLQDKVEVCRQHYARQSLPIVFKLWSSRQGDALDRVLQERNFAREAETAVKTCDVQTLCALPAHAHARVDFACTAAWFDAFVELNGVAATDCKKLRSILKQVSPPIAYVSLSDEGRIVSCGMGIAEGRDVGIFSLVTARNLRNRGLGQQLIGHIARWASGEGSERAYLQVMAENVPAWGLYRKLGFVERYRYWYRVGPI
jgi:N-acetylglutamate synthase